MNEQILLTTDFSDLKLFKRGKVRDVYDLGDKLLIVSTDRISCFDVVLPNGIPHKGRVLTGALFKRVEIDVWRSGRAVMKDAVKQIEIEIKYNGFIQRQIAEVARFKNLEKIRLPADFDYSGIPSLSREIREKLIKHKPLNLGQASRISGVTPVAISVLMVYLKKSSLQ